MIYNSGTRSYLMKISQSRSSLIDFQIEPQVNDARTVFTQRNKSEQELSQTMTTTTHGYDNISPIQQKIFIISTLST